MNKTIKVIDLLNKIANGEEVPKKIKINNIIYEYRGYMYCTEKANYQDIENYLFGKWNFNILNDTVEIIEDNDKLEKIEKLTPFEAPFLKDNEVDIRFRLLIERQNKIIDYINKIEEEMRK